MSKVSQVKAIKIIDGLFIGDQTIEKEYQFLISNQVTHIIHCPPRTEFKNKETEVLRYLYLNWRDNDDQNLFEQDTMEIIYEFIEKCLNQGESCIAVCDKTWSRSICAISFYLMRKFNWSLIKTLELLNQKKNNLHIKPSFFMQLVQLDYTLKNMKRTSSWQECNQDPEEIVIKNTYMNAHNGPVDDIYLNRSRAKSYLDKQQQPKIKWADQVIPERCSSAPRSILKQRDLNLVKKNHQSDEKQKNEPFECFKSNVQKKLENLSQQYKGLPPKPEKKGNNQNQEHSEKYLNLKRYYSKYLKYNNDQVNDENKRPKNQNIKQNSPQCKSNRTKSIDYEQCQGNGRLNQQSFRINKENYRENIQQTKESISNIMKRIQEYQEQQQDRFSKMDQKTNIFKHFQSQTMNKILQERQKSVFNRKLH